MQKPEDDLPPIWSADDRRVLLPEEWAHQSHDPEQRGENREVRAQCVSGLEESRATKRLGDDSGSVFREEWN